MTPPLDPILAAGRLWCPLCRVDGLPRDAAWLDDDRLLVTYERLCDHHGERTQIIVPAELPLIETRCAGWTAAGTWCRAWPLAGRRYCHHHAFQDAGAR